MSTQTVVSAKDVLRAIQQLRRRGRLPIIRDLEAVEPDLSEYLQEETTAIYSLCMRYGLLHKQAQMVHREAESICVVLVQSLRLAYRRLHDGKEDSVSVDSGIPPVSSVAKEQNG